MKFSFDSDWLTTLADLPQEQRREFLDYVVTYAIDGVEIDADPLIKCLAKIAQKDIVAEKEKIHHKSVLCSQASQRRTVKRGRNSFNVQQGSTRSNNVFQGTLINVEEQQGLSTSNKVLQGTLKNVDKNPITACKFDSYDVDILTLDAENGEISYTHNTNRDLNNNLYNNNLNSCTSNSGVCEEKKGGAGEKPKRKTKPLKTPEQKRAELDARIDDFHNEVRLYYGTYGEAYCEKFFRYYAKPNYETYKMWRDEKFGGFWNTEEKLQEWWEKDQLDLQKQQAQSNGTNWNNTQQHDPQTERARRLQEYEREKAAYLAAHGY